MDGFTPLSPDLISISVPDFCIDSDVDLFGQAPVDFEPQTYSDTCIVNKHDKEEWDRVKAIIEFKYIQQGKTAKAVREEMSMERHFDARFVFTQQLGPFS